MSFESSFKKYKLSFQWTAFQKDNNNKQTRFEINIIIKIQN